jgi:CheY-like chemotaxis protein
MIVAAAKLRMCRRSWAICRGHHRAKRQIESAAGMATQGNYRWFATRYDAAKEHCGKNVMRVLDFAVLTTGREGQHGNLRQRKIPVIWFRRRRYERDLVVLIVDDDPDIRRAIVQALEDDGMIGIPAASGQEALRILSGDSTIRLLLTDIMMPGIAGTVLADRAAELRPDVQIMFMTAYAEANRSWANWPVLDKPFAADHLCAAVRAVSTGANRLQ